jgi:hypothetical protein
MVEFGVSFTYPLYIKLLGGGKKVDIETSIKMVLMFTIPIVVGIMILAKPFLFLLNPEYVSSEIILQILTIYSLSFVFGVIFENIILGNERVDVLGKYKQKELIHSNLFKIPTLDIIFKSSYLITITIFTIVIWHEGIDFVEFGKIWALVLLFTNIPFSIFKFILAKKTMQFSFPWRSIGKFVVCSGFMGIILFYLTSFLDYTNSEVIKFSPQLFGLIGISVGIYFTLLALIDKETRDLILNTIILTIKKF